MSEKLTGAFEYESTVDSLVCSALAEIEIKYGHDGFNPLEYHGVLHTTDVIKSAKKLADLAIINGTIKHDEKTPLVIAAAFHDVEQDLGSGRNERASARLAAKTMIETGIYPEQDIRSVCNAIGATRTFIDGHGVMRQCAKTDDYLGQLLADADLSHLGQSTDVFWDRAERFFKEINSNPENKKMTMTEFVDLQVDFLHNHQFYTDEARELFPYKDENIKFVTEYSEVLKVHSLH